MNQLRSILTTLRLLWGGLVENIQYRLKIPYTLNAEVIAQPKNHRETYVFIHGVGNTLHSWDEVYRDLPSDVRVIGIDLLGFGLSPKPRHAEYNVRLQARSVMKTLVRLRLLQRPVVIGHSLGALVAIEMNRRYPYISKRLVLCSPPLYTAPGVSRRNSRDETLRTLYRLIRRHPSAIERIAPLAVKLGLASKSLFVTQETLPAYIASLELSIENQTSLYDVQATKTPVDILYGLFDPLVISTHLQDLDKKRSNITLHRISAGHEVQGRFVSKLTALLRDLA